MNKKEKLSKLQEEVLDKIVVARIGLLLRHPFFGNMATRLGIQECDEWCPTAATDGRNLYYNTKFFNKLDTREIEFVIAHEILHCVFDHITRAEDRDRNIYNVACDYVVNNTLVRDNIGKQPKKIPIFQDFKYEGWSSERVYDELYKKYDDKQLEKLGQLLDEHVDWEKQNGKNSKPDSDKKPAYSKEELRKIRDEIKDSILQSAQAAGAGNLPAEIQRIVENLTNPKMSWRELLQTQIQSSIKSDYSFTRPSRKGWHTNVVLPGSQFENTIDICVAIDASGSIDNNQLKTFLTEVKGIMDQYKDYKIKVWTFDTEIYNEKDFTPYDDDISKYKLEGGGGTEFMANWDYMKENNIMPKKLIVFTDGLPWGSWGDPDYCDTLFIINNPFEKKIKAPFGVSVNYEE